MARKARETALADAPELDEGMVQAGLQANDALVIAKQQQESRVRAVALQVGYQLPADCTDPDLIQRDIAINMRRSVEACLEVGRGLRVLKEACQHGQFMARLDVLGIEDRVARRFISAATKFSNRASTPVLEAAGSQTKLFELLVLDDDQIEELELTGQTGELHLDDIATMSVKELRAALRDAREQASAKDRLLSDKNAKIDELSTSASKRKPALSPTDERVGQFKAEIGAHFDLLDDNVARLYLLHGKILQEDEVWADNEEAERLILRQFATLYGDRIDRLAQQFAELQGHYEATLAGWRAELDGRVIDVADGVDATGQEA
ncbi:hypothetical protein [Parazoarcus communis]|uniref:hypothetical protein n=1 Tax=Parazoarcus communis TaxID=41977 RepID=UPI002006DC20|nr:hypothetical protein [Parazoarcus communis]